MHRATVVDGQGASVALRQAVSVSPSGHTRRDRVEVVLDGEAFDLDATRRLLAGLALAAEIAGGAR